MVTAAVTLIDAGNKLYVTRQINTSLHYSIGARHAPSPELVPMNGKFGPILFVGDDDDVLLAARMFLKRQVALAHMEVDPEKIPTRIKN